MAGRPLSTPRRLLQLWSLYGKMDFLWMTRDFKSFASYVVSDVVLYAGSLTATLMLAVRFGGIGPWSFPRITFMLGYALLVRGVLEAFFGFNVLFISRRIGRGQLDHVLIQPQPMWMSLLTEGFAPFASVSAWGPGVLLTAWSVHRLGLGGPGWALQFGVLFLSSAVVVMSFSYLWGSLAFWAPRGAEEISTPCMGIIESLKVFPLDAVGPGLMVGLSTVVPLAFVAWQPCRVLLGLETSPAALAATPVAALLLAAVAASVFRLGLSHYARTGSQRYVKLGHRS